MRLMLMAGAGVLLGTWMVSANGSRNSAAMAQQSANRKNCFGYTVIEAGKGLDCNGDTIKLQKSYGYVELVSRYEKSLQGNTAVN